MPGGGFLSATAVDTNWLQSMHLWLFNAGQNFSKSKAERQISVPVFQIVQKLSPSSEVLTKLLDRLRRAERRDSWWTAAKKVNLISDSDCNHQHWQPFSKHAPTIWPHRYVRVSCTFSRRHSMDMRKVKRMLFMTLGWQLNVTVPHWQNYT